MSQIIASMSETHKAMQREFDKAHGPDFVDYQSFRYFSDGAYRELSEHGGMMEPDRDPVSHAQRIVLYCERRLIEDTRIFDHAKNNLMQTKFMNGANVEVTDEDVKSLKAFQKIVERGRKNFEQAKIDLQGVKQAPAIKENTKALNLVLDKLESAQERLKQAQPHEKGAVQAEIKSIERNLQTACHNLDVVGGIVPDDLLSHLNQWNRRYEAGKRAEEARRQEIRNLVV